LFTFYLPLFAFVYKELVCAYAHQLTSLLRVCGGVLVVLVSVLFIALG